MTDPFEQRLRSADPSPDDINLARSPRANALKEQIMSETPTAAKRMYIGIAAAVLAIGGIAGAFALSGDDDSGGDPIEVAQGGDEVVLTSSTSDLAMESCIRPEPAILVGVDMAFDGTVTAVDGTTATLEVAKWFKGGSADTVTVENTAGEQPALIGGVNLTVGERYLISATNGNVNSCGLSGPVEEFIETLYADTFPE